MKNKWGQAILSAGLLSACWFHAGTACAQQPITKYGQLPLYKSTIQVRRSTAQILSYDASTLLYTAVATCTPGGNISCSTSTTGPSLVANCTAAAANSGNSYTDTKCSGVTTGPTLVDNCAPGVAAPGNDYVTTACTNDPALPWK